MDLVFQETRSVGRLNGHGSVQAEITAHYDDAQSVLCIDLEARHVATCEDDGTPRGCRFCAPYLPAESRVLATVKTRAGAVRQAVQSADAWFAEAGRIAAQLADRGPMLAEKGAA